MRTSGRSALARFAIAIQVVLILAIAVPQAVVAANATVPAALSDRDFRTGVLQPSSAQVAAARRLRAHVTWNRFGTPESLIRYGGWLAKRMKGSPELAARTWVRKNKALFKLSDADVSNLELVSSNPLRGTTAKVVLFRQRYGGLPAGQDGLIGVGIKGKKIAYVWSSASGSLAAPAAATIDAPTAWTRAAASVGRNATVGQIGVSRTVGTWTAFPVTGFVTPTVDKQTVDQRARLVAVPTVNGAKAAYETIVLDTSGIEPLAFRIFVDARSGEILMRYNALNTAANEHVSTRAATTSGAPTFGQFAGVTDLPDNCGPEHPIVAPAGTRTIDIVATATNPINDITIVLLNEAHTQIAANTETGTSPEALHYDLPVPSAGTFYARVCQFNSGDDPFNYEGTYATNDVASTATDFQYPPKWQYFPANPPLDYSNTDTRVIGCWVTTHNGATVPDCSSSVGSLQNLASRVPWDHNVQTNTPTYTTIGNNAVTAEAWTNPLAPGPAQQRPVHTDRHYQDPFTNAWAQSGCSPTNFTPGGNDILASVTSLFAAHNRMHDWSYFLGFTEENWNLQQNNFGNNPGPGQENDPEFGQSQAAAATGGAPSYLGRDNANQITLNDGIPGITNMYLFQPIAGAFYAPCVDGDFDFSIIGHEYTHAISNRMAGGPDANLTGPQATAMGEAWADLAAVEHMLEFNLLPTSNEDPFSVGAYATGNKERGIRNYNMSRDPLNYSDFGYDMVCSGGLVGPPIEDECPDGRTEEHSDAEIWTGLNYDIRQALVNKYNRSFPASNTALQRACALGQQPANTCPGNRRWIQIMFDAWLLMPAGVSMLGARDAYLAADMLRFGGANQTELWRVFARRGMGIDASTTGGGDIDPKPDFRSPREPFKSVTFRVFAADEGNTPITNARIYVGPYEAGVTPIADTDTATPLGATANFVAADQYDFLVVAPGYGFQRFPRRIVRSGTITIDVHMATNLASLSKGAVAIGTGTDVNNLFDDTENTNWTGAAPINQQFVTVDLAGGVQTVKTVNVSAFLNPENGGRFHALRQFEIWTCNGDAIVCAAPVNFTKIYTSPADAFPGVRPRPVAPDLNLRSFDVPDTDATYVQLRVVNSQCSADGTGFRGEQDNDPTNDTDCMTSDAALDVKAAEFQVFGSTPPLPPRDPAVTVTLAAPATAALGSQFTYKATYTNFGPNASVNAVLADVLPDGLTFVSATNGGTYDAATRTVTWSLGTVNVGFTGNRSVTVLVTALPGSSIVNSMTYTAPETTVISVPAVTTIT